MILSILNAIAALPALIGVMRDLIKMMEKAFGRSWPKAIAEIGETFATLKDADSAEKKQAVAKKLQDLIRKID